jgi:hypothetical protein
MGRTACTEPRCLHRGDLYLLLYLQDVGYGGVERIELAEDKDRWRALVNAVMNIWVP